MFAKLVQKWNALKADWAEYRNLSQIVERAWQKLYKLRFKITVFYNSDAPIKKFGCIKTRFIDVPDIGSIDGLGGHRTTLMTVNEYCPHFKDDNGITPCGKVGCPGHSDNCKYVAAMGEYNHALKRRRGFWGRTGKTK